MPPLPTLYTPRLRLRAYTLADAPRLHFLFKDPRIAANTRVPYPYPDGEAERWIATQTPRAASGEEFTFAITLAGTRSPGRENDPTDTGYLIGSIRISPDGDPAHHRFSLGYWIGTPYWNKGFATEAAAAVLDFAFTRLNAHRVTADHFTTNPASGRVMQKLGLTREGTLRQHVQKNGQYLDVVTYAILHSDWLNAQKTPRIVKQHALRSPETLQVT